MRVHNKLRRLAAILYSVVFTLCAFAVQAADKVRPVAEAISVGQVVNLLGGLVLVLLVFFVVVFLLKRVSGFQGLGKGHMKIVDALHLGSKERLLIVKVDKQHLLIGTSAQGIHPLHVIDGELSRTDFVSTSSEGAALGFPQLLSKLRRSEA